MQQVYLEGADYLQNSLKMHNLGSTSWLNWAGYSVFTKLKGNGVFCSQVVVHELVGVSG
jgi:hypothetical protein